MKIKGIFGVSLLILILCGVFIFKTKLTDYSTYRTIASVEEEEGNSNRSRFFSTAKYIDFVLRNNIVDSKSCEDNFNKLYKLLRNVRTSDVNIDFFDEEMFALINSSFKAQLKVRNILKELEDKDEMTENCLAQIRHFSRALRYVSDYVATRMLESENYKKPEKGYITLEGEGPHFLVSPKYKDSFKSWKDLKSGDIIVSRGNAFTSAAIARFTNIDTQFSHLTLVYVDEDGKHYTSEAHIEIGNVAAPFIEHIKEENSRTVVYRYKGAPTTAENAAKIMYDRILARNNENNNIEYDFSMTLNDPKRLFCSEVGHWGYKLADKDFFLPRYPSKFDKRLLKFLKKIGIGVNEKTIDNFKAFAPGDMEFDTRFEIVAEWKNFEKLRESRVKDMILTKMFEWIKEKKYNFYPSGTTYIKSFIGFVGRRLPYFKKKLKDDFPLNMNQTQLRYFQTLDEVGVILENHIKSIQNGKSRALTPIELLELLEDYRINDLKIAKKKGYVKSKLHRRFRPKGLKYEIEDNPFGGR